MNKKYKGVCEITLTDEDGKVVQQTRDENMVTNAVANIFKIKPLDMAMSWTSNATYLRSLYTNFRNFYGGVLLFDNTITENPDVVYKPKGVNNLGHAGGTYSGANTNRGSLNVTESVVVENGYKFVWDFPTSACNGVIKSVCLTSVWGGNCGYNNSAIDTDASTIIPLTNGVMGDYSYSTKYRYLKIISATEVLAVAITDSNKTLNVIKVSFFNKPNLSNADTLVKYTIVGAYTSATALCDVKNLFVTDDYILSVSSTDSSHAHYCKVSLEGALISDKIINQSLTFNYSRTIYTFGEIGTDLIVVDGGTSVYKINNITGETTDLGITIPYGTSMHCSLINEQLWFGLVYGSSSSKVGYIYDNGVFTKVPLSDSRSYDEYCNGIIDLASPVFLTNDISSSSSIGYYRLFAPYLATIDNLSSPITKTASLSMKVTYTITEVVDTQDTSA